MKQKQVVPKLLTTRDVVAIAGVGNMTVYNWRTRGVRDIVLPTVTEPAGERERVFFKRQDVASYLKHVGKAATLKEAQGMVSARFS